MRLTRVDIHGFKSFADRTALDFPPGLTAIVGPNGCGKSNVIDAIKWALGEQRPSALRGKEMLDVIFKGNGSRPARNLAEVSLHFENDDGVLPTEYREVLITRRLFRNGDSEYLLNRQAVRLKDVRDLLMDTGLGTGAYSVMEQGRIDAVLSANPSERRRVFEEAAGISRYRARRRESESKLQRTEQNLLRLGDVIEELEKRQRSLKVQAGRARSYLEARDRSRVLRARLFVHQWEDLSARLEEQERDALSLERTETEAREALDAARREVTVLQDGLARARTAVDEAAEAFRRVSSEVDAGGERQAALAERLAEIDERREALATRRAGLERALEERRSEVAAVDERLAAVSRESEACEAAVAAAQDEHAAARDALDVWRADADVRRTEALERVQRLTACRNERSAIASRHAGLVASRDRLAERLAELTEQVAEQDAIQGELFAGARDLDAALEAASERGARRRARYAELNAALAERDAELARLREERAAAASRRDALDELIARRDGVSPGALALLEAGLDGVEGLLVDHLRAPEELAEAVEAALGATTQAVLVRDRAAALAALEHLESVQGGRVLLVPREGLTVRGRAAPGRRLLDAIEPGTHRDVLEALLGHVRLVDDRAALERCVADGVTVWVSRAGELLDERGVVRGGQAGEDGGLVSRRAERDALVGRCAALDASLESLARSRRHEEGELATVEQQLREAEQQLRRVEHERERTRERERQLAARREALDRESTLRRRDLAVLEDDLAREEASRDDVVRREAELEAQVSRDREREAEEEERAEALGAAVTRAQDALAAARLELSARQERHASLEAERRQVVRALEERGAEVERVAGESAALGTRRDELEAERAELASRLVRLSDERDERAGVLAAARAAASEDARRLETAQQAVGGHEQSVESASATLSKHRLAIQETAIRRDELRSKVLEELEVDLATGRPAGPPGDEAGGDEATGDEAGDPPDWDAIAREIETLRDRMARMGNVNLTAVDELAEVDERLGFLVGQRDDLVDARRALQETIAQLNRESRERFVASFEQVREHFRVIFRKLFRGGRADIVLEESDDVLEAGIDITAAPPGKDARSITLLSGGERTLTAVGLLFALFRARPSPVCLLDEVDAALDETNIDRFCSVLEDFLGQSQFVVVTHARRTMSYADTIFGVTMQEHGVSQVLSLSFDEYERARGAVPGATEGRDVVAGAGGGRGRLPAEDGDGGEAAPPERGRTGRIASGATSSASGATTAADEAGSSS